MNEYINNLPPQEKKELDDFIQYTVEGNLFKTHEQVDNTLRFHKADPALPLPDYIREAFYTVYHDQDFLWDFAADNYEFYDEPYHVALLTCTWDHSEHIPDLGAEYTLHRFSITSACSYYIVENPPETSYFEDGVWEFSDTLDDDRIINRFKNESEDAFYADLPDDEDFPAKIIFTEP